MSHNAPQTHRLLTGQNLFRLFKYAIFALLAYDAVLFFQEDLAASAEMFGDTITWRNVIEAYSATIDTVAWVILLLIFELETAIIPDHLLRGRLKWFLKGLAAVCYFFIVYSFYGYIFKYGLVTNLVPFVLDDICSLIGTDFTYVLSLDEYLPLDQAVCTAMNGQPVMQIVGTEIIGTKSALDDAIALTLVDVINAGDWLLVVAILEIEVLMQLKGSLTDRMIAMLKYIKGILYLVLLLCAIYWGVEGSFLDFWDAFLWLVAFIFIELNIFQWHSETEEEREHILKV